MPEENNNSTQTQPQIIMQSTFNSAREIASDMFPSLSGGSDIYRRSLSIRCIVNVYEHIARASSGISSEDIILLVGLKPEHDSLIEQILARGVELGHITIETTGYVYQGTPEMIADYLNDFRAFRVA